MLLTFLLAKQSFGFTSVSRTTFTAAVTFTGTGQVSMTTELRNISNDASTTTITWSGIILGQTDWKAADQYIVIHATITAATGLIQIYTHNKDTGANPQYTGIGNPAGLVRVENSSQTLKMCWRITDYKISGSSLVIVQASNNQLYAQATGPGYPCFLWMKDRNTPNIPNETTQFQDGEDYVTVWEANRGCQHAEGTWASMPSPNYLYLGAKFLNAVTPSTYRTNRLILEAAIE